MSRGPGVRQRQVLAACDEADGGWVTIGELQRRFCRWETYRDHRLAKPSDAESLRRAIRQLVRAGRIEYDETQFVTGRRTLFLSAIPRTSAADRRIRRAG
jgi:hypothetical protein